MEKMKFFYLNNHVIHKKPVSYLLGLDVGSSYFGISKSLPDLSRSVPLKNFDSNLL